MSTDQRPPSAGGVTGWGPGTGPSLDAALDRLRQGELTVLGRLPWSSNLTFLVSVDEALDSLEDADERRAEADPGAGPESDGSGSGTGLYAVYKPARGEQSLWDFPDGLYRREVAAFALSEALGWGLVPPTVEREDGPFGAGSLQLFVEADYEQHYFTLLDENRHRDTLETIGVFDIVANNADRKGGHVLVGTDDRLWGIDHGLCFHALPKLRTVIWDFAGEDIPTQLIPDLERLIEQVPDELGQLLDGDELTALAARVERLLETGTFPEPIGQRPPYPWPLV